MNVDTFQNFDPKTLIEMFLGTREQTYDNVEEFIHTAKHNVARGLRPFHVDMSNGVSLDIRFNLEMDPTDAVRPMWYAVKVRYAHDNNWLFERHVADIDKSGVAYYSDPEHIKALSTGENSYSYKVERMVNTILARYERSTVQHFGKCQTDSCLRNRQHVSIPDLLISRLEQEHVSDDSNRESGCSLLMIR